MLTIVGWLWKSEKCRTQYTPHHANIWARMIHRNLRLPHRFVLFTDQMEADFDPLIEAKPLWGDYHLLGNPVWRAEFPQCYVRLKAFSREMAPILGDRFVSIDLDCTVVGNLDPIFTRDEDFLIYRHPIQAPFDKLQPYNGSMWMMTAGCRAKVWEAFKGDESLRRLAVKPELAHFLQTDQGWICYQLGRNETGWTMDDGVYMWSWLQHKAMKLPENARIVFFNGAMKPWDYFWIGERYA